MKKIITVPPTNISLKCTRDLQLARSLALSFGVFKKVPIIFSLKCWWKNGDASHGTLRRNITNSSCKSMDSKRYPPGNDDISHLRKKKIIDSKGYVSS